VSFDPVDGDDDDLLPDMGSMGLNKQKSKISSRQPSKEEAAPSMMASAMKPQTSSFAAPKVSGFGDFSAKSETKQPEAKPNVFGGAAKPAEEKKEGGGMFGTGSGFGKPAETTPKKEDKPLFGNAPSASKPPAAEEKKPAATGFGSFSQPPADKKPSEATKP
jgi:hypothetical protein